MSDNYEELQKKQLFAQRVTAASGVVTALAARRAAESLEEMRRDASIAAQATAQHQFEMQKMQQQQLTVIEEEARSAAKEREYQRQVLFLKESNDSTKLEAFLEMLKGKISCLYKLPEIPEECKTDGEITRRINSVIESDFLPAEAKKLNFEIELAEYEKNKLEAEDKRNREWHDTVAGLCICLIAFGLIGWFFFDMNTIARNIVFGIAAVLVFLLVFEKMTSAFNLKVRARKEKMFSLGETKAKLDKELQELQPFIDLAFQKFNKAFAEGLDQWQSVVELALLQSFFDQGLWIEDGRFTERLKVELARIQKPFPTSCRTEVYNLQSDQITLVFQAFTDSVANLISECSAIGKDSDEKLNRKAKLYPKVLNILRSGPISLEYEIKEVQLVAMQREAEAQREATAEREAAAQRKAAKQRELEQAERAEAEQREAAAKREAAKQSEATAQREAIKLALNAPVKHPVGIWFCRIIKWVFGIIGIIGCLAIILVLLDDFLGKKTPNEPDLGVGGVIGMFVMLLIFGGMTVYGFWPRKKKQTVSPAP